MCTAISIKQKSRFFGRTLDLNRRFSEEVVITGEDFPFIFRHAPAMLRHYAIIGIGTVIDGYPLYYDAINEHGLAMAGLNFVGNAHFQSPDAEALNIAQFELLPYILGKCKALAEAKRELKSVRLVGTQFNETTPTSELHFFLTDGYRSLTAEPTKSGFMIYDNPFGVLTNNPPFPYHKENINNYISLTRNEPTNRFADGLRLSRYSHGMGALGLPGDSSSASRFVRAAFTKFNAVKKEDGKEELSQVFNVLGSVNQVEGVAKMGDGFEKTVYTAAANLDTLTYYYKTYENHGITAVRLGGAERTKSTLTRFPLKFKEAILFEN